MKLRKKNERSYNRHQRNTKDHKILLQKLYAKKLEYLEEIDKYLKTQPSKTESLRNKKSE